MSTAWRRRSVTTLALALPAVAFLAVFFILPFARVVGWSVDGCEAAGPTLAHYEALASTPLYLRVALYTLRISLIVTVITLVIAYPVSFLLTRLRSWLAAAILFVLILPFWISALVRTFAWATLLQRNGPVNDLLMWSGLIAEPLDLSHGTFAVVVATIHWVLPFMVLSLYAGLRAIDPVLLRAASGLGARPGQTFRRVLFPLSLPAVVSGCGLVFILTVGSFVTPVLLGGLRDVFVAQLIEMLVNQLVDWPAAAALTVALLVVVLVLMTVFRAAGRSPLHAGSK
ncbi:ABC transporter permease [Acuticoccus sediminis]|nr:ABC transporter permease [Acuticoccus sediminis]